MMLRSSFYTAFILLPLVFILSGCYPHIGPDGNAAIPVPTSIEEHNNLELNTGGYINQCYEKGFYDAETHDDMLNGWTKSQVKLTGKKPVITSFEQSVDYRGCEYFLMNFDNYGLIPHIDSKGKIREVIRKK